jgi:excisionase family DNA binding protein
MPTRAAQQMIESPLDVSPPPTRGVGLQDGTSGTTWRGLLRINEAAKWLGLSKRKTYDLVYKGEISSVYIGRSRRVPVAALERFLHQLPSDPTRG